MAFLIAIAVTGIALTYAVDSTTVRSMVGFPAAVVLWSTALLVAKRG